MAEIVWDRNGRKVGKSFGPQRVNDYHSNTQQFNFSLNTTQKYTKINPVVPNYALVTFFYSKEQVFSASWKK